MIHFAHRGCICEPNTIKGIINISNEVEAIEIDVRFNTKREVVICHDRVRRNDSPDLFEDLLKKEIPLTLLVDIKAFGIHTAATLGETVVSLVSKYPRHRYMLCSFNEYCVLELSNLKNRLCLNYLVGVIAAGLPIGIFSHLDFDFVSFKFDVIHEELVMAFRSKYGRKQIFCWTCNEDSTKFEMDDRYHIDGIIYDKVCGECSKRNGSVLP
jgi:glycerophosphoryl diester phosphodiesterase